MDKRQALSGLPLGTQIQPTAKDKEPTPAEALDWNMRKRLADRAERNRSAFFSPNHGTK